MIAEGGKSGRKSYGSERGTTIEATITEGSDTFWDCDGSERGTTSKTIVAEGSESGRKSYGSEVRAERKTIIAERGDATEILKTVKRFNFGALRIKYASTLSCSWLQVNVSYQCCLLLSNVIRISTKSCII